MVVGVGGGRRDSAEREAEDARFVRFFKDDESKAAISSTCDNLLRTYMREGRLEKKTLQKEIWELSSALVTKWGDPNKLMACSECAKKLARMDDLEHRLIEVQKNSLKEIAELRKNVRRLETEVKSTKGMSGTLEATTKENRLDQMVEGTNNEFYEPLNHFDAAQRDLMIDCVNEKVRAILTMDPKMFGAGKKLPFGMRMLPEEEAGQKVEILESRVAKLEDANEKLKQEKFQALDERDQYFEELDQINNRADGALLRAKKTQAAAEEQIAAELREAHEAEIERVREECSSEFEEKLDTARQRHEVKIAELQEEIELLQEQALTMVARGDRLQGMAPVGLPLEQQEKLKAEVGEANHRLEQCKLELAKAYEQIRDLDSSAADSRIEALKMHQTGKQAEIYEKKLQTVTEAFGKFVRSQKQFMAPLGLGDPDLDPKLIGEGWKEPGVDALLELMDQENTKLESYRARVTNLLDGAPSLEEAIRRQADGISTSKNLEVTKRANRELEKDICVQKEENDRLQMLVDELRRRIVQIKEAAEEQGVQPEALQRVMESVGLNDVMEADGQKKVRKVFQRLYEDAMERLRRYQIIRAKVLAAQQGFAKNLRPDSRLDQRSLERKYRGVEEYCDIKLQEWAATAHYNALPPDYFLYGWVPEESADIPFSQYIAFLEENKRPMKMERTTQWRRRNPPSACEKRPVDRRENRTWSNFSGQETSFSSPDLFAKNVNARA